VIVLDHNIAEDQSQLLRARRIHFKQIGVEAGRPEWDDFQEILRYLHRYKQITFFTRDFDFFQPRLRHTNYALIVVAAPIKETAAFITRFLRHPEFRTKAQRCGKVIRLSPRVISWWEIGAEQQRDLLW
jgi:hypothetical protein